MHQVTFTRNLQRHLPVSGYEVAGATVNEALAQVFEQNPLLRNYILDDQGCLRKHVAVFVNGETVLDRERLSDPISPGSQLYVMQALSGG